MILTTPGVSMKNGEFFSIYKYTKINVFGNISFTFLLNLDYLKSSNVSFLRNRCSMRFLLINKNPILSFKSAVKTSHYFLAPIFMCRNIKYFYKKQFKKPFCISISHRILEVYGFDNRTSTGNIVR